MIPIDIEGEFDSFNDCNGSNDELDTDPAPAAKWPYRMGCEDRSKQDTEHRGTERHCLVSRENTPEYRNIEYQPDEPQYTDTGSCNTQKNGGSPENLVIQRIPGHPASYSRT
jgi:hypothetical protein